MLRKVASRVRSKLGRFLSGIGSRSIARNLTRLELEHNHRIWTLEDASLVERVGVLEEMVYRHGVEHNDRISELERTTADMTQRYPDVLFAIESTHGNARLVRREMATLEADLTARLDAVEAVAARLRNELDALAQHSSDARAV